MADADEAARQDVLEEAARNSTPSGAWFIVLAGK